MRIWCTAAFAAVLILSACSSGLSRQEYATSIESLIATMDDRLIEAGREYCGELPPEDGQGDCYTAETSIGSIRSYVSEQAAARQAFVEGFEELEPPSGMEAFHDTALQIMIRLAAAEAELAEAVAGGATVGSLAALFQLPQGQGVAAAEGEAIALCQAAQADFDSAEDARLAGSVWIPAELKEVVSVAFRCTG